jgi:hypothetical protein
MLCESEFRGVSYLDSEPGTVFLWKSAVVPQRRRLIPNLAEACRTVVC